MAVKINIPKHAIEANIRKAWEKGLPELSELVLQDCNEYCKRDEGDLIASSLTHSKPQEGKLIWQTPYARRQYWEIQTAHKDKNPKATWKWCEAAKVRCRNKWKRQAQKLFEDNL